MRRRPRITAALLCAVVAGAGTGAALAQTPDPADLQQLPQLGSEPPGSPATPAPTTPDTTPEPPTTTPQTTPTTTTPAPPVRTTPARELPNTGTQPDLLAALGGALLLTGVGLRLRLRRSS